MIGIGNHVSFAADGQILVGVITGHVPRTDGGRGFTHYLIDCGGISHRIACLQVYNVIEPEEIPA